MNLMIQKLLGQAWKAAFNAFRQDGGEKWLSSGISLTPCEMKEMREQHLKLAQKIRDEISRGPEGDLGLSNRVRSEPADTRAVLR